MSEIDGYRHRCIGIIQCPSSYEIVPGNNTHRNIPLYMLEEDALTASSWQGKRSDLLLGGGSGESAALRIAMPEAIYFETYSDWGTYIPDFQDFDEICYAYWSVTEAFIFGEGYTKLGWTIHEELETWLTDHILAFVEQHYPDLWNVAWGSEPLQADGSICRLPTAEEVAVW